MAAHPESARPGFGDHRDRHRADQRLLPERHLLLRGVQLEQIRGDCVLHEALAVRAGPLHLAAVFNLGSSIAIARTLLEHPIEAFPLD